MAVQFTDKKLQNRNQLYLPAKLELVFGLIPVISYVEHKVSNISTRLDGVKRHHISKIG